MAVFGPIPGNGILFQASHVSLRQITDGTSKTLLIGEVISDPKTAFNGFFYSTWDILHTANGINNSLRFYGTPWDLAHQSFSSYHPAAAHFVFADGSVQFFAESVSPTLLAALTTRANGELAGVSDAW